MPAAVRAVVCAGPLWHDGGVRAGGPVIRALRAAAFTAACVLASAVLHVLVGGSPIRPGALPVALAAIGAGAYALGGRRLGWPELLAACVATQYVLHRLFTDPAAAVGPPYGHEHGTGPGMAAIHLAVAMCSSWWLARGEVALAMLLHLNAARTAGLRALVAAVVIVLTPVDVAGRPCVVPVRRERACLVAALLAPVMSRRGPPALASALG
ncbi:hypothetical protein ABZ897_35190 [Nonomuraea sp. NPDC046802]|uniref:hypothetical protein n=1 Tax=Nonomuraea sp. NPDC046802 TaxID=3154919 RepID=UPI0033CE5DB5